MSHWYLLYFLCALLVGVASLTIVAVTYARNKADWMPYYLYFYAVFTVLVGLDLNIYYWAINLPTACYAHFATISYPGIFVAVPLLTLSLPVVIHTIGELPDRRQLFRIIGIVVGSEVILQHIVLFTIEDWELCETIGDVVILGMIIYSLVLGNRAYHHTQQPDRKRLVSTFVLLLGFCLFCQILDVALSYFFSIFLLYPLGYCSIGVIFAYASLRTILQPVSLLQPKTESLLASALEPLPVTSAVEEAEFGSYGLSEREKEILLFVLKGCSNADVAEMARISVSTVKAHLTNIYEKIGVKNRYELITYFSNPQFPLQKTEEKPANNGNVDA